MINTVKINATQLALVKEIVAFYDNLKDVAEETRKRYEARIYTRKELRDAHGVLRGKKAAPYFMSKNLMCKAKAPKGMEIPYGCYTPMALLKHAEKHPPKTENATETAPAAPAPAKGKRESAKGKKETPAIAAPAEAAGELMPV